MTARTTISRSLEAFAEENDQTSLSQFHRRQLRNFRSLLTGYSAEFGRSTGGIVNAVTKSGTNSHRGSAFYLYRPSGLAKGNEFTDALADQKLTALGVDPTLAATQHQFGGSIGGPIKKEKLFYFGAYEQQRFRAPRQIVFSAPTDSAPGGTHLVRRATGGV